MEQSTICMRCFLAASATDDADSPPSLAVYKLCNWHQAELLSEIAERLRRAVGLAA